MKNRKVVITGGAGFIGSNLSHALAVDNAVTIVDNIATGRMENIATLIKQPDVTFVEGSILDLGRLTGICKGVDFIFHEAAIPSVPRSIADPLSSNEANVTGTLNVLLAARDGGVKKVIFASSSSVYGDTPTLPKIETMFPNPKSPYALTKMVGEYYCQLFYQIYGLPTVALRYFNVYGPRQNPDSQYAAVVPRFISLAYDRKSPVIYGDGSQKRDFTYVMDVVRANMLAAESDATGVFNIGTGHATTVNSLAQAIIEATGAGVTPRYEPIRAGDIKDSLADISRASTFGYEPRYSLADGLKETIGAFNR